MTKISRLRPLLGTFLAIEAAGENESAAATAIASAFAAVQRVHSLMHPDEPGSDLARLAATAPGTRIPLDPWTCDVIRLAMEFGRMSGGLFDPCVPTAPGRLRDVELEPPHVVCRVPVRMDLGGIAKGYAVDRAIEALQRAGIYSGLVNAGGDLRVFGPQAFTVQLMTAAGAPLAVELRERALAVSGPRTGNSPPGHLGFYVGTSGAPVAGRPVAIVAPSAARADALCKCALLCAPAVLDELLAVCDAQVVSLGPAGRAQ